MSTPADQRKEFADWAAQTAPELDEGMFRLAIDAEGSPSTEFAIAQEAKRRKEAEAARKFEYAIHSAAHDFAKRMVEITSAHIKGGCRE